MIYRNGDKRDIRIENLMVISRARNMRRNSVHTPPPELADVCQIKGVLTRQINKRIANEKQD